MSKKVQVICVPKSQVFHTATWSERMSIRLTLLRLRLAAAIRGKTRITTA